MQAEQRRRHARLVDTIAEILEIDRSAIGDQSRLREDLGMDSLASLELLSVLSHELRIDLEMEEAMSIETVADAFAFVERHYVAQHAHV
jgi:acyl carrier protein